MYERKYDRKWTDEYGIKQSKCNAKMLWVYTKVAEHEEKEAKQ